MSTVAHERPERRFWLLLLIALALSVVNPLLGIVASAAAAVVTPRRRWVFVALAVLLVAWLLLFSQSGVGVSGGMSTPVRVG